MCSVVICGSASVFTLLPLAFHHTLYFVESTFELELIPSLLQMKSVPLEEIRSQCFLAYFYPRQKSVSQGRRAVGRTGVNCSLSDIPLLLLSTLWEREGSSLGPPSSPLVWICHIVSWDEHGQGRSTLRTPSPREGLPPMS